MIWGVMLATGSALAHAGWNTLVKRVSAAGLPALWAYSLAALGVVVPVAVVAVLTGHAGALKPAIVGFSAISTVLHTTYAASTQAAYRQHDVTQVYPLARGLAPVIVAVLGALTLGQHLDALRVTGIVMMAVAVALLGRPNRSGASGASGRGWSLAIAVTVAAYTTWDGWVIVHARADPLTYYTCGAVLQLAVVTALVRGRLSESVQQLREHRRVIALLAVLIPMSYVLALYATRLVPVSVVAAVRASSLIWVVVIAAAAGTERVDRRRVIASTLALAAIVLVSI